MSKLNHYRAALYLCAAIAVMDAIWILKFTPPRLPAYMSAFFIALVATIITILGLLLLSNLVRCFGAILMITCGAGLLWGLIAAGDLPRSPLGGKIFLYYLFVGALNLLTAAILLLSKQFAYEFAKRRESAPKYIGHLRLLLIGAIVAAMLVVTFNDIVYLTHA